MENRRDYLVVILAGYKDRMDEFFRSNPRMPSRVAHRLDFPDFTLDELRQIEEMMLAQQKDYLDGPARGTFRAYGEWRCHTSPTPATSGMRLTGSGCGAPPAPRAAGAP